MAMTKVQKLLADHMVTGKGLAQNVSVHNMRRSLEKWTMNASSVVTASVNG